jgi:hypothetical protein
MNWDAIAAVAELLGAIGVIASLFYVASQIRRNSTALESATNQAVSDSTQQRLLVAAESAPLAAALAKSYDDPDDLSPGERVQVTMFVRASFRGIQNAFFQHSQGLMTERAWRDYEVVILMNVGRPFVHRWWRLEGNSFDEGFVEYVDRLIADSPAAK